MLTDGFKVELAKAVPGARVTGVVHWELPTQPVEGTEPGLSALAQAKRPLLEAARACPDTRVNALEALPQSILDAPVESWWQLLRDERELLESEAFVVDTNPNVFRIASAP